MHTLFDVVTSIPCFLHISEASLHDVNALDIHRFEAGSFYIMDKAYIDFRRLFRLHKQGAYFVTRAKENMRFKRMYQRPLARRQD